MKFIWLSVQKTGKLKGPLIEASYSMMKQQKSNHRPSARTTEISQQTGTGCLVTLNDRLS